MHTHGKAARTHAKPRAHRFDFRGGRHVAVVEFVAVDDRQQLAIDHLDLGAGRSAARFLHDRFLGRRALRQKCLELSFLYRAKLSVGRGGRGRGAGCKEHKDAHDVGGCARTGGGPARGDALLESNP